MHYPHFIAFKEQLKCLHTARERLPHPHLCAPHTIKYIESARIATDDGAQPAVLQKISNQMEYDAPNSHLKDANKQRECAANATAVSELSRLDGRVGLTVRTVEGLNIRVSY